MTFDQALLFYLSIKSLSTFYLKHRSSRYKLSTARFVISPPYNSTAICSLNCSVIEDSLRRLTYFKTISLSCRGNERRLRSINLFSFRSFSCYSDNCVADFDRSLSFSFKRFILIYPPKEGVFRSSRLRSLIFSKEISL